MQGQEWRKRARHPLSPYPVSTPASVAAEYGSVTRCFMDAGEVAALVGVNRETVLRAWRTGNLAGYATNRKLVRFTREDVEEWMESGRRARSAPSERYTMRPTGRGRRRRRAA